MISPKWVLNTAPKEIAAATREVTFGMKYAIRYTP